MNKPVMHALPGLCLAWSSVLAGAEVGSWLEIYAITPECDVRRLGVAEVKSDGHAIVSGKYRVRLLGMSLAQMSAEIEAALPEEQRRRLRSIYVQTYKNKESLERGEAQRPLVMPVCKRPREFPLYRFGRDKRVVRDVPPEKAQQQPTLDPASRLAGVKHLPASRAAEPGF